VEEAEQRAGEEDGEAEAHDQAGDDHVGARPARSGRSARHDHRDHRDDAGRQPRDQSADECDDEELTHGSRSVAGGERRHRHSFGTDPFLIEASGLGVPGDVAPRHDGRPAAQQTVHGDQRELDLPRDRNRRGWCTAVYLRDTLRGTTKPNRVTWLLWAVAPLLAAAVELSEGVGLRALPTFMVGFMPLLVFVGRSTTPPRCGRSGGSITRAACVGGRHGRPGL
jgi:hypothetical protein